ncbi:MAG: NADH-quinone oxidoreductase subunit NuoE [Oscillospiraceae bacterium]|nr:NADH-quinone oxidoreductase subunit NuoE [Oscillospiraceae bacterium]MBQ2998288.1 NADH-quinone oxidoreductase subunit NuoE [Oscillospiraceae bacterium]
MNDHAVDFLKLEKVFEEYENIPENLISVLQKAQEIYGFLPKEVLYYVAEKLGVTTAKVIGVATFYSQFRLEPMGKYVVTVCGGTACHVSGSEKVLRAICGYLETESGKTTPDGIFTLQKVACLGCCSLAPVMMINGEAYGRLTPEKAVAILEEIRKKEASE